MIKVTDLWKRYGKLQILKGLSLEVLSGETVVILGRSGVGKSVLLRQILGIEHADKGSIAIDGKDLKSLSAKERLAMTMKMGMLFQGAAMFDSMTVGANTAFYLNQHEPDLPAKEVKERAAHALEMVGLAGTQDKMPSELSGGMRKRAALARLIVYRPTIVLYDEPTTGLDPITSMQISELIVKTQEELKATSIVVTHDIRSALTVGQRLAFHNEGKIAFIAPKEEFIHIQDPLVHDFLKNAMITEQDFKEGPH